MASDGDDRDAGHGEATAARLRGLARDLNGALCAGRAPPPLRHDQREVGLLPCGDGLALRVVFSPSTRPDQSCIFVGVFRVGPDGELSSASGSLRINCGALPGFAAAIADSLELATERVRSRRPPAYPSHQASRDGGIPSTAPPAVTHDAEERDTHQHQNGTR
jgi:hypothetical protein